MKRKKLISLFMLAITSTFLAGCELVVFQPQGPVARSITELINWSLIWMLVVVVVVFSLFGYIVWKYRERPENMDYEPPEEHGSTLLEIIWTGVPILIVIALTIPTVKTLYALEDVPVGYEDKEPITIHVTSADWKWIFSYPDEDIETVNYVNIPAGIPIDFRLTSASTMQSFWVPALGGQKYTMGKMETQMYLIADNPGSYFGRNTNFNGRGYAEMEFEVQAQTSSEFYEWIEEVKNTAPKLTEEKYNELLKPTHLGRMTFSNSHLAWVDHSDPDSPTYTNPELYRHHGYQGKIFEEEDQAKNIEDHDKETPHHDLQNNHKEADGGGHDGH
jgi:cytochrome aa3-600 menaquinol oxidase subunit II